MKDLRHFPSFVFCSIFGDESHLWCQPHVEESILTMAQNLMDTARGPRTCVRHNWSVYRLRITAGILAVYRMRLIDITMREHILLLWIMCGQHMLRSHDGSCFFYKFIGHFTIYEGMLPPSIFAYVKQFLLTTEGCFRAMQGNVPRTDEGILAAVTVCCSGVR